MRSLEEARRLTAAGVLSFGATGCGWAGGCDVQGNAQKNNQKCAVPSKKLPHPNPRESAELSSFEFGSSKRKLAEFYVK